MKNNTVGMNRTMNKVGRSNVMTYTYMCIKPSNGSPKGNNSVNSAMMCFCVCFGELMKPWCVTMTMTICVMFYRFEGIVTYLEC